MLKRFLLWSAISFLVCMGHVAFTNLKCNFTDKSIGEFKYCLIKAVNRTHKYISIYAKMFPRSIDNVTVNIRAMRNSNGYKPISKGTTVDACKFLKKPKNPILLTYYNTIKSHSNLNHTCPYNHDIIIDKVYTGNHELGFTRFLPLPRGDYAVIITFNIYNAEACQIHVYLRLT